MKNNKKTWKSDSFRQRKEGQLHKYFIRIVSISSIWKKMTMVFIFAVIVLLLFEVTKGWIFSDLTIWKSHIITIVTLSIIATVTIYFFNKGFTHILRDLRKENVERKLSEKALQESEEKLRSIMENSPDAIFMVNPHGKYIYTNKAVTLMLGYSSEDMKNKTLADISPPNKIEEYYGMFKTILTKGSLFTEIELLKSDGNYISTDLNAVLLPDGTVFASCRDITERKVTTQNLKESKKKLLRLNADKDRFISILGHDLRNPFGNILGLSEILVEDLRKADISEIEVIANQINATAQNTSVLLDEILVWASTQQGSISSNPQLLNLRDICLNVLEVLKQTASTKNITINYSAPDEIKVYADIDMLKTILRNIISNAIKFTKKDGVISINADKNSVDVRISVSDTGVGISDDNLTKLFDISQIVTTKGTSKENGTGLGLLICKEFVENHGGKIGVESALGKGSDFYFTLPYNAI